MAKFEIRTVPGDTSGSVILDTAESQTERTWYIDSVNGTDGSGQGLDRGTSALATLAYLITNATTLGLAAGDNIELAPSHNEGIADAQIDLATAGLKIYAHPDAVGDRRPTFDFDHANAEITFGADNITLKGVNLRPSITDVLIGLEMESGITGCTLQDVDLVEGEDGSGTDEFIVGVKLTSGNHDTAILDCNFRTHASAAGSTHAISIAAASNRLTMRGCTAIGPWGTAGIAEAAAGTGHIIEYNSFNVTTGTNFSFDGSSTFASRMGNQSAGAVEDTATNILGANNSNNAIATTSVAANADGSVVERVEYVQSMVGAETATTTDCINGKLGTDAEMGDRSVYDLINGSGPVTAATAAAPANNISMYAVLRDIWDVLRAGTGGTEPTTNKSILDIIGCNLTAMDAAAAPANNVSLAAMIRDIWDVLRAGTGGTEPTTNKSILDIIGCNLTAMDAAARASNSVSIAAVLRELSDYAGLRCVEKSDGAVAAAGDDLFTITGGPIMVVEFVGIVTTVIGGAANCQIQITTTEPAGTVNLSTDVAIDNDAAGTSYTFTVATPGVLTPTTAGALDQIPAIRWLCPIGTIKADTDATQTGVIKWYMTYRPLSENSRVAAAA